MIIKGTTYTFMLQTKVNLLKAQKVDIIFSQNEEIKFEKSISNIKLGNNNKTLLVTLAANETFCFDEDVICNIQAIIKLRDGTTSASDILQTDVSNSLLNYF